MTKVALRWTLGALLFFAVQGCVRDIEMVGGFDQIEPKSLLTGKEDLAFEVDFVNPNFFKVNLLDVSLAVKAGDTDLGQISLTDSTAVQLAKKDTTTVSFTFSKRPNAVQGMMKQGLSSMLSKDPILVQVDGEVVGKAMGKTRIIEVHEVDSVDISLPKLNGRKGGRSRGRW